MMMMMMVIMGMIVIKMVTTVNHGEQQLAIACFTIVIKQIHENDGKINNNIATSNAGNNINGPENVSIATGHFQRRHPESMASAHSA